MSEKNPGTEKKILISTIGSRGEVQPALALALELRALGHRPILCVPPTFKTWVESFSFECVPLGPDVKQYAVASTQSKPRKPSIVVMRQMMRDSIIEQFKVTLAAAQGCHLILTAGDLQHAGKSVAELLKIPHVHATYCPVTLRSSEHTPPNIGWLTRSQSLPRLLKRALWRVSDAQWNKGFRQTLNEQRVALGLSPLKHVPSYIANEHSIVAADELLAPAKKFNGTRPFQSGAWMLPDERPLPEELEKFLDDDDPPIYFGFGSMGAKERTSDILIEAARALNRRAIVSRGWGNLSVLDEKSDCISIGDVSHGKLFARVAAIVHHGGAGTSHAAARAGKPQVIVPHLYDQFYWAHRVQQLRIGAAAGPVAKLTKDKLIAALKDCIRSDVIERAQLISTQIEPHGARVAAQRVHQKYF